MAARGNSIILTGHPRGVKVDCIISGTPKPGTVMEIQTPFSQGGLHKMRVFQRGTDGQRATMYVLLEDDEQGQGIDVAYVDGKVGKVYVPLAGEEMNMRYADVAGTADDHTALEFAIVKSGTGLLIATTGSPNREPFQILVAITDPIADFLAPTVYTGM